MVSVSFVGQPASLRRRHLLALGLLAGTGRALGGAGRAAVVVQEQVPSAALGRTMPALVYLPPAFDAQRRYPVLYLYHGLRETHTFWRGLGLFDAATALIERRLIQPLLIVTPQLDNSFGVNNAADRTETMPHGGPVTFHGGRYEDYLVHDLVDFVDARYPTRAERAARSVGGISMGGFAALHAAFRHPDRFGRAGGHSPALVQDDWNWLYPAEVPRASRDVQRLAAERDLAGLQVYLDCGEQDDFGFAEPVRALSQTLRSRGVAVRSALRAGRHDSAYWMAHLDEYLQFYAG